jgi:hypothetical protein
LGVLKDQTVGSLKRPAAVALFVLATVACDWAKTTDPTPSPTPTPAPTSAHIDLTITPTPIPVKVDCPAPTNPDFCLASFNPRVTVQETAGLGGRINSVEVTVRNVTLAKDETKVTLDAAWVARQAGTNRLEAKAGIAFEPVVSGYPIPAAGPRPQLRLILAVQFIDDKSNTLFPSAQADLAF